MTIKVKQERDPKFLPLLTRIREKVLNLSRINERGIVNKKGNSSIAMRESGDINVVASKFAQQKTSAEGKNANVSTQEITITNTKKLTIDELIINNHKFNNLLFEYTDPKMVNGDKEKIVTGLAMQATVLTKSWEPTLKRYVMIRRPARFNVFSPEINIADVPKNLSIETAMQVQFKDMSEIEKAATNFDDFTREEV